MAKQVIITLSVELCGDDIATGEPDVQRVDLENSPAQLWEYAIQAGDNYLQISDQLPPTFLWIDPALPGSGASFTLKGLTGDVGIPISSTNPSLIPVALGSAIGSSMVVFGEGTTIALAPQNQLVLVSSQTVPLPVGWF